MLSVGGGAPDNRLDHGYRLMRHEMRLHRRDSTHGGRDTSKGRPANEPARGAQPILESSQPSNPLALLALRLVDLTCQPVKYRRHQRDLDILEVLVTPRAERDRDISGAPWVIVAP